jgi:hypothetical protein
MLRIPGIGAGAVVATRASPVLDQPAAVLAAFDPAAADRAITL